VLNVSLAVGGEENLDKTPCCWRLMKRNEMNMDWTFGLNSMKPVVWRVEGSGRKGSRGDWLTVPMTAYQPRTWAGVYAPILRSAIAFEEFEVKGK
jgi:hypothetical protein